MSTLSIFAKMRTQRVGEFHCHLPLSPLSYLDGRRLSCQVRCFGSVTVDLTEQINKVDTQKKVRGFKSKDTRELSAVQDTMILTNSNKKSDKT